MVVCKSLLGGSFSQTLNYPQDTNYNIGRKFQMNPLNNGVWSAAFRFASGVAPIGKIQRLKFEY